MRTSGHSTHRILKATLAAAAAIPFSSTFGMMYDLTPKGPQSLNIVGDVGGTAIVRDYFEQPTGTGVFDPFLTLDSNGQTSTGSKMIEQAYNTDGHSALYLDEHRPSWNTLLRVSDLATIAIENIDYFAFILDSNEPGGDKSLISIDNIRIYTSATDDTAQVGNNTAKLDDLGTLRWAMNDPIYNNDNWIKLDSSQENVDQGSSNSNGGSGKGDMVVYIPQSAFGDSLGTDDYIWFYNLNGAHYDFESQTVQKGNSSKLTTIYPNAGLAAESGFEEWRAVTMLNRVPPDQGGVPDTGSSLALFGIGLAAFGFIGRRLIVEKHC